MRISEEEPDSRRSAMVWLRLGQLYGKGLHREHGEEPNELWEAAIHKLADHEVKLGLKNLAEEAMSFPPNIGQFVAACKRLPEHRPWTNPSLGRIEVTPEMKALDQKKFDEDMKRLRRQKLSHDKLGVKT